MSLLTLLGQRRIWTYQLGRFFTASTPDQAAPLTSPYTEAGAVGSLTVTDTGSKLSVSGGVLICASNTATNDPRWISGAITRAIGRTLMGQMASPTAVGQILLGLSIANDGTTNSHFFEMSGSLGRVRENGAIVGPGWTVVAATTYDFALILRSTGTLFLIKGGIFTQWTLFWVGGAGAGATLYPAWRSATGAAETSLANLRVANLGGAWASDYGIATDRKATSAATDTITHTANGLIEHTITAATGVTQELWVRRTDASNGWIVRMDQAGSTIKLIELVAGVETERASTAQTWTNATAYRVVVICDGTTITPYVANVAKTGYASASTNQSATTAYVDTAGSELIAWPRTVALPNGV